MRAKEVLQTLNISRPTLSKYVKDGIIKIDSEINGQYNYNEESVNRVLHGEGIIDKNTVEQDIIESIDDVLHVLAEIANLDSILSQNAVNRIKSAYKRIIKYKDKGEK